MKKAGALSVRHYCVDEAGDGVLFDSHGRVLVGTEGCSRFFVLGLLDVGDEAALNGDLASLRARLLADPYFKKVPSLRPEQKKTALIFHAKDDIPEVRREVFELLLRHNLRFFAVVRNKLRVLEYVRQRNDRDKAYHYHPNELYDALVRRLFKNMLHKDDEYHICFARRGGSDRTEALRVALEAAQHHFSRQWGVGHSSAISIENSTLRDYPALQAVDYCLWALQRLYERREERYVEFLWPLFHLVHDVDDTRQARYGVYYTQKKPLTLAALPQFPGI